MAGAEGGRQALPTSPAGFRHSKRWVVMGSKGIEGKAAPLEKGGRQTGSPEFLARGQFQREGRVTI